VDAAQNIIIIRSGTDAAGPVTTLVEEDTLTHLTGMDQEEITTSTEQYISNKFFNHASKHRA